MTRLQVRLSLFIETAVVTNDLPGSSDLLFEWKVEVKPPPLTQVSIAPWFKIQPYFLVGSGLLDSGELAEEVILFRSKALHELFQFLERDVLGNGCLGRVYGPPGTGKSLAIIAFSSTLLSLEWNITWLHFSDRRKLECVRFQKTCKMTRYFYVDDLDRVLPNEEDLKTAKHLVILDGIRDSRLYPEHQKGARTCREWYLSNRSGSTIRLIENSSIGALDSNTEETDRMLKTAEFCMFSWESTDYNLAVEDKDFRDQIAPYLDTVDVDESESSEECVQTPLDHDLELCRVRARLKAKFFFSGGSARYMFSYSTDLVKKCICRAVDSEKDVAGLLRGIVDASHATSSYATHRLTNCFPHPFPVVCTSCLCTVISRFAVERLSMKACPDAIEVLANSLKQDMNPSMEGWIFEMLFFSRLRLTGVHLVDKTKHTHVWQESVQISILQKQTLEELPGDRIWLRPYRWNQGGYDAVFVDKTLRTVRFVQVTRGKKHSFKIQHFRKLLDQFGVREGHVEIFFLVPVGNIEEFAISEVTGHGCLAAFSPDSSFERKWKKSEEINFVQVVGMQQR